MLQNRLRNTDKRSIITINKTEDFNYIGRNFGNSEFLMYPGELLHVPVPGVLDLDTSQQLVTSKPGSALSKITLTVLQLNQINLKFLFLAPGIWVVRYIWNSKLNIKIYYFCISALYETFGFIKFPKLAILSFESI